MGYARFRLVCKGWNKRLPARHENDFERNCQMTKKLIAVLFAACAALVAQENMV